VQHRAVQRLRRLPEVRSDDRHQLAGIRANGAVELLGEASDLGRRPTTTRRSARSTRSRWRRRRRERALDGGCRRAPLRRKVLANQLLDLALQMLDGFRGHAPKSHGGDHALNPTPERLRRADLHR
jgi:hypothetical protein